LQVRHLGQVSVMHARASNVDGAGEHLPARRRRGGVLYDPKEGTGGESETQFLLEYMKLVYYI
jgi:hypothetical protein